MDRQDLIDEIADAMQDVQDMDTNFHDFAAAAVKRFGWREIAKDMPDEGDMVIATNGKRRWVDTYYKSWGKLTFAGPLGIEVATHWHPILPLDTANTTTAAEEKP